MAAVPMRKKTICWTFYANVAGRETFILFIEFREVNERGVEVEL